MRARIGRDPERQRGQGLVEFALMLPIMLLLVVSVGELGVIFGNTQSLVYAAREGARVGSALATGEAPGFVCTGTERDPSLVDGAIVAAVQRILKSPDSGVKLNKVSEIRIFKATAPAGAEATPTANWVSKWNYIGPGIGYDIDPDPNASEWIDFRPSTLASSWRPCDRINTIANPDSIGVSVLYQYDFVMPIASVINGVAGGRLNMTLKETTVMALNPDIPGT